MMRKGSLCNLRTMQALISLRIRAGWSGPSLSAYRINGYCNIYWQTENVHIRLHGCARSSGPLLFGYGIRAFFPCYTSYGFIEKQEHTYLDSPYLELWWRLLTLWFLCLHSPANGQSQLQQVTFFIFWYFSKKISRKIWTFHVNCLL